MRKSSSHGAFKCTTWFVWNKLAASKTLLWKRQKGSWVSRSTRKSSNVESLFGLLTYIITIAYHGMHHTNLVKNIFNLLVPTFINKKRRVVLEEHISIVATLNILGSGRRFLSSCWLQTVWNEWLNLWFRQPFVSFNLRFWSFSCPPRPKQDLLFHPFARQHLKSFVKSFNFLRIQSLGQGDYLKNKKKVLACTSRTLLPLI